MAVLRNNTARLLVGPTFDGDAPRWSPGPNKLDPGYWRQAKRNETIRAWLHEKWIEVDLEEETVEMPSEEELASFSKEEILAALVNQDVPVQWHPALEEELNKRENEYEDKKKSLVDLKIEEALPLIEAETDVDMLEAWADNDKRLKIKDAIDEKLKS